MVVVTSETVEAHFDQEALHGRRLFPDRNTVSGLGTWRKYERAADLMADPLVHDVIDIGCTAVRSRCCSKRGTPIARDAFASLVSTYRAKPLARPKRSDSIGARSTRTMGGRCRSRMHRSISRSWSR